MEMRVLVCGGRNFRDSASVFEALAAQHRESPISLIIEGGALGADEIAALWADCAGVKRRKFKADWTRLGRSAGPIRNALMIAEGRPDLVIAFPGGKGTADMIAKAKSAGIPVREIAAAKSAGLIEAKAGDAQELRKST
jgi:hypothetical protein